MGTSVPSRRTCASTPGAGGRCGHVWQKCKDGRVADTDFDVLILGAGSGGYACALRAAQLGLTVGLVEKGNARRHLPPRRLHPDQGAAARRRDRRPDPRVRAVRRAATLEGIDMAGRQRLQGRRRLPALQGPHRPDQEPRHHRDRGRRAADRPAQVTVGDTTYAGKHVVLASGSYSRTLPGLDIDGERVITSEHALKLDRVPASVVVLGGGVIGCEFASVWRSFGAEVTIVEALPRLVAAEDEASSKALERAFRKRKIAFRTGTPFQSVKNTDDRRRRHRRGRRRASRPSCCWSRSAAARRPTASATTSRASRWTAASCSPTSAAAPTSRASTPSATSSPASSSPTAASSRASSSPRTSPGSTRSRSTRPASRGSPTPTPRSPRSASTRPRPPRRTAPTRSRRSPTTSAATARARSSRPRAS